MLLFPDALGIGTSEHSMIGKFIDTILDEEQLPQALILQKGCDQMPNICGTAATLGGA